jgi:uncharacterized membrane protein
MNRRFVSATLAAAIGLAASAPLVSALAAPVEQPGGSEKCFGIAAKGKNDCAAGAHSCAGQATMAKDPKSFVFLPKGACGKIAGGMTMGT